MTSSDSQLLTHHSYWIRETPVKRRFATLSGVHKTQVAVLGAGLTGLSTAIELLERGYQVTVLEALVVGGGTTGGSSGHLDAHPEQGPKQFISALGEDKARIATRMRQEAIDLIEKRSAASSDFRRISAYQTSENPRDASQLRDELEAALRIGLEARWSERIPLPYAAVGYEISRMGRFQSMNYLENLLQIFLEKGGQIFEQSVASGPTESHPTELEVGDARIQFEHVVCAVHCNYTNAMRIYLQTPAYQSYVLCARVKNSCADALFWDNSSPYYYTRRANSSDPNMIVVGGCDHRTGKGDPLDAESRLREYVHQRYEVEEIISSWSAELFEPVDGLPIIGQVPGKENVWIATGLSGIGLTWGTVAGRMLAEQISGKPTELADELSPSRFGLGGAIKMAEEQFSSALNLAERVLPAGEVDVAELKPGEGKVGMVDGKFTAVCRDRCGNVHAHNPRCVHMGGVVHWNAAAQTWDCPVHGGRYAACGSRIYSPPESDLVAPDEKAAE